MSPISYHHTLSSPTSQGLSFPISEGGQGGGNARVMGALSLREVGEERVGDGIPKGAGAKKNLGNKFCNIGKLFAI